MQTCVWASFVNLHVELGKERSLESTTKRESMMLHNYPDIIERLGKPLWWDEVGCPRYDEFKPNLTNNIYAREVILLEIACANCDRKMLVAMSWCPLLPLDGCPSLRSRVTDKTVHYGDPPCFDCSCGATENCTDFRVVQFWQRANFEWSRVPELEVDIEE